MAETKEQGPNIGQIIVCALIGLLLGIIIAEVFVSTVLADETLYFRGGTVLNEARTAYLSGGFVGASAHPNGTTTTFTATGTFNELDLFGWRDDTAGDLDSTWEVRSGGTAYASFTLDNTNAVTSTGYTAPNRVILNNAVTVTSTSAVYNITMVSNPSGAWYWRGGGIGAGAVEVWPGADSTAIDFYYDDTVPPEVAITFPEDNSTSTADLFYISGTFDFQGTDLGLPLSRGWVEVNYGTSSGNYSYQDQSDTTKSFSAGPAASGSWDVTRTQVFPASSTVYAQATLHLERWYFSGETLTSTTLQIATSSEISFGIGTIGAPFEALFSATTTLANLTGDCSPDFLINSLCGLFRTLFIPSTSSLQIVNTIKDRLSTKPPFGYISSFVAAVGDFTDTATSTADFTAADGLASVFAAPRTMLSWLIWTIWGFWLFRRFRHFQF